MKDLFTDPKTITAAGGILLAALLAYFIYDLAGTKINSISEAFASYKKEDIESKNNLAEALTKLAGSVDAGNKISELLLRRQ